MSEWISIEDELPPINERVLVFAVGKDDDWCTTDITQYTDCVHGLGECYGWVSPRLCYFINYRITHWMPLPTPPEGEEERQANK